MFGKLSETIFKPLAGPGRHVYGRVILRVYDAFFADDLAAAPARETVIWAIGEELRKTSGDGTLPDLDLDDPEPRSYPHAVYSRLRDTGWLVESRSDENGWDLVVEMPPEVLFLVGALLTIRDGLVRSYGGDVVDILNNLEAAYERRDTRAQGISAAAAKARDFLRHLRGLVAGMRDLEKSILGRRELGHILESFFGDFVERLLIADYKKIKTRNNPFLFRRDILDYVTRLENPAMIALTAPVYVAQGAAPDDALASERIRADLQTIRRVFESVDTHLAAIDRFREALEERIENAVHYMSRTADTPADRIAATLRRLGDSARAHDASLPVPVALGHHPIPAGGRVLYRPRQRRPAPEPAPIREGAVDPAYRLYKEAVRAFSVRVTPSPERIAAYLERHLDGRDHVRASELKIESLEDFVAFERLRGLPHLFRGRLKGRYAVVPREGLIDNGWIVCRDFEIRRARAEGGPT